jgi:fluoride exporter
MWMAVALGGALGSAARHAVNIVIGRVSGQTVPYSTAAVNLLGCALIGVLAGLIAGGRLHLSVTARAFVFVGVLGGFTTFSSFGLDTMALANEGRRMAAFWNVVGQVGLGLLSVFGGYALAIKTT